MTLRTVLTTMAVTAATMYVLNLLAATSPQARRIIKGSVVTGVAA